MYNELAIFQLLKLGQKLLLYLGYWVIFRDVFPSDEVRRAQ